MHSVLLIRELDIPMAISEVSDPCYLYREVSLYYACQIINFVQIIVYIYMTQVQ